MIRGMRKRFSKTGCPANTFRWLFSFALFTAFIYALLLVQTHSPECLSIQSNQNERMLNFVTYNNNKFCVLYNFWTANIADLKQITLVVHASPKFINYIPIQALNWDGPLSVAVQILQPVYVYTEDSSQIPSSSFMRLLENFRAMEEVHDTQNVSLHLFFEQFDNSPCPNIHFKWSERIKLNLTEQRKAEKQIYPINVGRNIARLGSKTKLFLSNDIENIMVPNYEPRMRKLAMDLLLRKKKKTVLVHRRFEIATNVSAQPRTKKELEKLYEAKLAVQFHRYVHSIGHRIPQINEWFRKPENFTSATVAKEYNYLNAEWEPQFVADASIPLHDERFPLRMRSNTHLGNLLCRQGYTFTVVNDLFSVHHGIKKRETEKDVYWQRLAVRNGYRKTVRQFRAMLDVMYPGTKDQCPFPRL